MPVKAAVFDAYGTLFDVAAAARIAAGEPGREALAEKWEALAQVWRLKQLQYTWLRASSGTHTDFWAVTQDGLDYALEATGLTDLELRERLLALYWELAPYKEVPEMLVRLKTAGFGTAILSNGSPDMLEGAVKSAGVEMYLDHVLSVEDVGVFKPARVVYEMVTNTFDCAPQDILFVSANGWDAAFGAHFGFRTVWVNRLGEPMDRLPAEPTDILSDLVKIPELAAQ